MGMKWFYSCYPHPDGSHDCAVHEDLDELLDFLQEELFELISRKYTDKDFEEGVTITIKREQFWVDE